ncbi:hypothetical protein FHR83_005118 [Actinoplanes campanulatus]|uniref:Uncharacterized protein n=1 Tax=Actinoplanes campanulatus TaxID=113559 RepID=A0A7W5AJU1_9ACTN|nr:hypothetical protein [Actinoplanes campanulatus]MBB3097440.1 hypothetical protein [Actinoplanes campanulatus]GGN26870.1 hypothetical protein GCM10010109_44090 [Actinoplanes campanulatus]GID38098.1 hypothetical protein Aca09nite_46040 [Actinoplanes campanulatus]
MRHATPGLIRLSAPSRHRRPARSQRHAWREPYRTAHLLTRGLAALIVLGICVMLGVLFVADERDTTPRRLAAAEIDQLIASRAVDPEPLTEAEVFPSGSTAFGVQETGLTADCTVAVTGALRFTLQRYGCSQAVRAALTVPYADYRVTAGMLNLSDATGATAVGDQVRSLVESGDGGFAQMSGEATGAGTPVVWRTRGHYLMYCVITGPDGALVPADEPQLDQLTHDLLDVYLSETVLSRRV